MGEEKTITKPQYVIQSFKQMAAEHMEQIASLQFDNIALREAVDTKDKEIANLKAELRQYKDEELLEAAE